MSQPINRCSDSTCVEVTRDGDGVVLTSTIGTDRGLVRYDDGEWTKFVADVKAGAWDHTVAENLTTV